jgi:hypothetical protein
MPQARRISSEMVTVPLVGWGRFVETDGVAAVCAAAPGLAAPAVAGFDAPQPASSGRDAMARTTTEPSTARWDLMVMTSS